MSQGTLIGIDQLVLGATAACDLLDLDGHVAVPVGTPITPQLLARIKEAGIVGLVAGRPDFVSHHFAPRRPPLEIIASRITEMQRRSGIACPLSPASVDFARKTLEAAFDSIAENHLPDIAALEALSERIAHDIELLDTAPLPCPRRAFDKLKDRLVDGGIDMAVILGWHLAKSGADKKTIAAAVLGGLFHDIGLLQISPGVLDRSAVLNKNEFREIRRHPYLGVRALSPFGDKIPRIAREIVLLHHEREDGQGYPLKHSGDSIPEIARLAHILDTYIALVSPRPHREAFTPHRAIEIMLRDSGRSFNGTALREFVQRTGRYPQGSAVVLSTNEVGVVVGQGKGGPFRPIIDVYFSRHHQFSQTARRIDLSHEQVKYVRQVMQ